MQRLNKVYIDRHVMASIGDSCDQFAKAYKAMMRMEILKYGRNNPLCYQLTLTRSRLENGLSLTRLRDCVYCPEGNLTSEDERNIDDRVLCHEDILYAELKKFLAGDIQFHRTRESLTPDVLKEILDGYDLILQRAPTSSMTPYWQSWSRWLFETIVGNYGRAGIVVVIPLSPVTKRGPV